KGAAAVVVGVEEDLEGVVVADVGVAGQRGGDDLVGLRVVAAGGDVEVVGVITEVDLGLLGRRLALFRLELGEAAEVGRRLPDRLVQLAVDHRPRREAGRTGRIGVSRGRGWSWRRRRG